MDTPHRLSATWESATWARRELEAGRHDPSAFRAALARVPAETRDAWLDEVLSLGELPDDGPELPRGCTPYLPCAVDVLLRMIEQAGVRACDVFVDLGSGLGRTTALVHLVTGASAIGLEIQPALVASAGAIARRLGLSRVSCIEGDAASAALLAGPMASGTVFFLYCPFGGDRLTQVLDALHEVAHARPIRVCCVDLPLPRSPWLRRDPTGAGDLAVYRSTDG